MEEPHFDVCISDDNLITGAIEIVKRIRPSWSIDHLSHKVFTNGISNKLVGIYPRNNYNQMVLVRVYGHNTDLLIDRKQEHKIIRSLNKSGFTHSIYATFSNGMAYEFIEGNTLTVKTVREPEVYELVAKTMAKMHLLKPPTPDEHYNKAIIWEKTEKFLHMMPINFSDLRKQNKFEKLIKPKSILLSEYQLLKEKLLMLDSPIVFCHNDLLLANILHDKKKNKVTFIDFEYAAYNCQSFDIANHFAEFAGVDNPDFSLYPDIELQMHWLSIYLKAYRNTSAEIPKEDVEKLYNQVNQFVLLTHFFWGCWALIQSQYSLIDFDFLEYAEIRFNEYFRRK
ncbi:ethanolamine kinase 1 [Phymastichus coffea]|uniref:ethanolamine kinase 1 n=1 Tax=Phymastichus coffea TaxID=108790 RepID=UPI00273AE4EF|nr:ethanolamine kinase 1 [Phymastichus coffea]XP_058800780.1 ethanolamine kinase 1 [Phymastichus coffea]XP_058800781.1 ethanolamine kinase 1 [Phymastichus coffea]